MKIEPITPFEPILTESLPTGDNWVAEPLSRALFNNKLKICVFTLYIFLHSINKKTSEDLHKNVPTPKRKDLKFHYNVEAEVLFLEEYLF